MPFAASAASYTPPLTALGRSQVSAKLNEVRASGNQNCINQMTAYEKQFNSATVGLVQHPGPIPQCAGPMPQDQSGASQTITITTAPPKRVNDRLDFAITTNQAASRVVLAWDSGTATMTSSNGRNWNVSLKASQFSPTNGWEEITVRAYPPNSMVAVTKAMNVSIPSTAAAQNATTDRWEKSVGKPMISMNSAAFASQNNPFPKGQCTWYAHARFLAAHNIRLRYDGESRPGDAKKWMRNAHAEDKNGNSLISKRSSIADNCVAVRTSGGGGYGHVVFVEHVNAKYVYYTEANGKPGKDGILQRAELPAFIADKSGYICRK